MLVHRWTSSHPSAPTQDYLLLLEHVQELVEHREAARTHRLVVLATQSHHVIELDLLLTRTLITHKVVVSVLHGTDHHSVLQHVLELQFTATARFCFHRRHLAMQVRYAWLRKHIATLVLQPIALVEHAEQRRQIQLPRVNPTRKHVSAATADSGTRKSNSRATHCSRQSRSARDIYTHTPSSVTLRAHLQLTSHICSHLV